MSKPKKSKKRKIQTIETRSQMHQILDLVLNNVAETGKSYSGKYKIPLTTTVIEGSEGLVSFEVEINAKFIGRFKNAHGIIEVDTNKGSH